MKFTRVTNLAVRSKAFCRGRFEHFTYLTNQSGFLYDSIHSCRVCQNLSAAVQVDVRRRRDGTDKIVTAINPAERQKGMFPST